MALSSASRAISAVAELLVLLSH